MCFTPTSLYSRVGISHFSFSHFPILVFSCTGISQPAFPRAGLIGDVLVESDVYFTNRKCAPQIGDVLHEAEMFSTQAEMCSTSRRCCLCCCYCLYIKPLFVSNISSAPSVRPECSSITGTLLNCI